MDVTLNTMREKIEMILNKGELLQSFCFPFFLSPFIPTHFCFAHFSWPFPSSLLSSSLMGLPDSWFHWHVFANNRLENTDHSILCCPNISDCFHIRPESLETPQHLLFMVAINYSPWYELQSRKAKLETVAHFDGEIRVERDRQKAKGKEMNRRTVRVKERDPKQTWRRKREGSWDIWMSRSGGKVTQEIFWHMF